MPKEVADRSEMLPWLLINILKYADLSEICFDNRNVHSD